MGKHISDYLLYKKRYILGYSLIGLIVIGLLLLAGWLIPGGLSQAEMDTVATSSALSLSSFDPHAAINLPYHSLQRVSIEALGLSQFSIKLPSLLLGALSAWGMIILLRTWFRHNVAIIATGLTITTGQFLFIAQSGTPSVIYVFLSVWLLVAALMVSRRASFSILWKILLFTIAALSLYTPLSIYILLALFSAMILHPHLRYIVRHLSPPRIILASFCALLILVPLGYAIFKEPSIVLTLLGIPSEWPQLTANAIQLLKQYADFITPGGGEVMTPVYGLGSMILILLGILNLFTTKYTARSYIITAWIIMLLPILIINPSYTSITFVPVLLLMAMGIHTLLRTWYQLFPHNPYARIAGLIPLAVLIGGMIVSGIGRYTYGYLYDPQVTVHFSKDLQIISDQLKAPDRGQTTLITSIRELPFYTVVAHNHQNVTVTDRAPKDIINTTIITRAAKSNQLGTPAKILTNDNAQDADRFYVYKMDKK